jgi:crotonobetainyl-CoA:carnitine CoA-transferase CaiB-like acyl-CoA transferase
LCAYIHRLRTGRGQLVDTSLLEGGIAYTVWESAIYFATGITPPPVGSAHRLAAPYQAFRTADGYLNLGAANQANWEKLCRLLERSDLLADPRFHDNPTRTTHAAELAVELEHVFATCSTVEWLARLDAAGVPAGPLYDMPAVYADPHVQARQMMAELEHPTAGRIKNIGIPVKLSETPGAIRRPAPSLGQHSDEVLAEFGFSQTEIAEHHEARVVV